MPFSFNAPLSGLNANSNALGVAGNNIANANTVGYRSSSITFADVFTGSQGVRLNGAGNPLQVGQGVRTSGIFTNFSQGGINDSGSTLHAAIQGNGFFVVRDSFDSYSYTRAGDFTVNRNGHLLSTGGQQVQGYIAVNGAIPTDAAAEPVRIPIGETLAPQVTTEATFRMNLNAESADNTQFHAAMQVYDTRGVAHTLDLLFIKQPAPSTDFTVTATLDGTAAQLDIGGGGIASTDFSFDVNGYLTAPTQLSVIPDPAPLTAAGASLPAIEINLRETNADGTPGDWNVTGFARPSSVAAAMQDGYTAGEFQGALIDQNGNIFGNYSNGQTKIVAQLALAIFNSPEGLNRIGGNMFSQTVTSGEANIGKPNTSGRGSIVGASLEQSNVDITGEFVRLIEAQRGFQANSRVINTMNQTFQDLMQNLL